LRCTVLNNENYDVKFSDVYGNIDQQYKAVKVYKTVMRRRKVYLEIIQIPLALMGALAPGSAHARPSTQAPINTSGTPSGRKLTRRKEREKKKEKKKREK
jgi:hypothetical protein